MIASIFNIVSSLTLNLRQGGFRWKNPSKFANRAPDRAVSVLSGVSEFIKAKTHHKIWIRTRDLISLYGIIAVNPMFNAEAQYDLAMAYIAFVTSSEGQTLIGQYQFDGDQLFVPNAN